MYDELAKRLQDFAAGTARDEDAQLAFEAADAIEELSREYESVAASLTESVELVRKLQQPRWIPVTERLPEEDSDVIAFTDEGMMFTVQYMGIMGDEPVFDDDNGSAWAGEITHWMPLPEPPTEE